MQGWTQLSQKDTDHTGTVTETVASDKEKLSFLLHLKPDRSINAFKLIKTFNKYTDTELCLHAGCTYQTHYCIYFYVSAVEFREIWVFL